MKKQFLTKRQAKEISDIMGYKYSHHDEYVKYEDFGDTEYHCYFYLGMCP